MALDMSRQRLMWFAMALANKTLANESREGRTAAPHPWCGDGGSLYVAIGLTFTRSRLDPCPGRCPAWDRGSEQGAPLKILDTGPATAIFYGGGRVLSRPDQHVA